MSAENLVALNLEDYILSRAIFRELVKECVDDSSSKFFKEIDNVVSRFMISYMNACLAQEHEPVDRTSLVEKMVSEVKNLKWFEKVDLDKLYSRLRSVINIHQDNCDVFDLTAVLCRVDRTPTRLVIEPVDEDFQISLGETSLSTSITVTTSLAWLLQHYSLQDVCASIIRHLSLCVSSGQHWRLPQTHIDYLYTHCGIRYEAFTSPMNSGLIVHQNETSDSNGVRWFSLFPEDKLIGSSGNFFDCDLEELSENIIINPPFIETVMNDAATKILEYFDTHPQTHVTAFYMCPEWSDCEAYQKLTKSPWCIAEITLNRGRYHYLNTDGEKVYTSVDSHYFALSRNKSNKHRQTCLRALKNMID